MRPISPRKQEPPIGGSALPAETRAMAWSRNRIRSCYSLPRAVDELMASLPRNRRTAKIEWQVG